MDRSKTRELNIRITDIDESQKLAIESMFHYWLKLWQIWSSRPVSFFAAWDASFWPKIIINWEEPKLREWYPPAIEACDKSSIAIDYDEIARKIYH